MSLLQDTEEHHEVSNEYAEIHKGNIEGALFKIVIPKNVQPHSVLIWCHGYRPRGIALAAIINHELPVYQSLLKQGFIISATSYRREGYILKDSVEDVKNLRNYIVDKFLGGNVKSVIIESESMGGAISTFCNERYPELFSGILAVGAAMFIQDDPEDDPIRFNYKPKIPQIFVCNSTEVAIIQTYLENCEREKLLDDSIIIPAIWHVKRGGHCEVNDKEIEVALTGILQWVQHGEVADTDEDITHEYKLELQSVVSVDNRLKGSWGTIKGINIYKEVTIDFIPSDLEKLFIFPNTVFTAYLNDDWNKPTFDPATVDLHDPNVRKFDILYGIYPFSGVQNDEWVAGTKIDGYTMIRKHFTGNNLNKAADEMAVRKNDRIFISEKRKYYDGVKKPVSNALLERMKQIESRKEQTPQ